MTESVEPLTMTYAEYLALERQAEVKHELIDGKVFAMSGGTPEHGRLALTLCKALGNARAGKPCEAFSSDRGDKWRHKWRR